MRLKIICFISGLFVLVGLIGCSPKPEIMPIEYSYDHFVAEQYWNTSLSGVYVSATVRITLGSNPTTGFAWPEIAQINDQDILKQTNHEFLSSNQPGVLGASGKDTWTFKAIRKGTATISMIYSRPGEDVGKEWAFQATIIVE
jgi:predicted secreted protein